MQTSRELWLKTICGLAVALAAAPLPAQVFGPLAYIADTDENTPAEEASRDNADYWIGVRCVEVPELLRAQLDLPEGQGVLIDDVVPDGPAQHAGLKAFDVIAAVDGKPMNNPRSLAEAVSRAAGRELKIEYVRAGHKQTLTVKPAPRPDSIAPQRQDQRALRDWVERLGQGPAPMRFRLWHPGMVLPPGASLTPELPDDMTVTIEKRGGTPAKVTVKQGDKQWEANEDALDKLPEQARDYAQHLLGWGEVALPSGHAGLVPRSIAPEHVVPEERFNRRLEEMSRQLDDLRRAIEKLQNRRPSNDELQN